MIKVMKQQNMIFQKQTTRIKRSYVALFLAKAYNT